MTYKNYGEACVVVARADVRHFAGFRCSWGRGAAVSAPVRYCFVVELTNAFQDNTTRKGRVLVKVNISVKKTIIVKNDYFPVKMSITYDAKFSSCEVSTVMSTSKSSSGEFEN